ncbi:MAG: pullulanase-associated domain-containing protein, partial [Candidatus Thorarchaeota archaeon]
MTSGECWGDTTETIDWTSPKPFLGEDEYGRFAWVALEPGAENVGFIIHRGDVKDGTTSDRFLNPSVNPEIWTKGGDANTYTSQADAQGFVTVHYHRGDGDYGDYTSDDFVNFWGIHLWGNAIDPSEGTDWTSPKKSSGSDDYGVFWNVQIVDTSLPVNFIIHRGDVKDPGPDQSFLPQNDAAIWIQSGDDAIYSQRGAADGFITLHYHRPVGDYGDPTSPDYNDFWGLHTWDGASDPGWTTPRKPDALDSFGAIFKIDLLDDAEVVGYILHRGDNKDPGPDQFLILATHGYEVWQLQGADVEKPYVLPISGNSPPSLTVDEEIVMVDEGQLATNNGSVSDADGDTVLLTASVGLLVDNNDGTWSWSLSTSDGPDESQTVTITGDDGNDGTSQTTFELAVNNVAPTVNIGDPKTADEGETVAFTGNFTDSSPADMHTITWTFGDGSAPVLGTLTPSHVYADDGIYTATLTVTDDDGGVGIATVLVTIGNLPPVVDTVANQTIMLGDPVWMHAGFSDPGIEDTHTAAIYWDDGSSGPGTVSESGGSGNVTGSHVYTWPGSYVVEVEVADDDGGVSSGNFTCDVLPVPEVMLETLRDDINTMGLPKGKENSLNASLDTAIKVLEDANPQNDVAAINALQAF